MKEEALLSQKVEILELQLKDSQEREENLRRMHDTMLGVFRNETPEKRSPIAHELEIAEKLHQKELEELKQSFKLKLEGAHRET